MNPIRDLELVILTYESEYFSASSLEVTEHEASYMAMLLMYDLVSVVRYCGTIRYDGLYLSKVIDMIRL